MPKKIIAVLLSVLVIVTAFALPSFAAEVPDLAAEEAPVQYATNLVPFPYRSSSNVFEPGYTVYKLGLTFTFQSDGGIRVSGTATSGVTLAICNPFDLREGTYTVSGYSPSTDTLDEIGVIVRKLNASGNNVSWIGQGYSSRPTGTLVDDESVYYVAVFVGAGKTVDGTVYPMLNMGDFAAPYMLYLPYLLEQQYKDGYTAGDTAGNKAGYDQGFLEGTSAGIIQGTTEGYKQGYQAAVDMIGAETMNPFLSASLTVTVEGDISPSVWSFDFEVPIILTTDGALSVNSCVSFVKSQMASWHPDINLGNANYIFKFSWVDQSTTKGAFDCEQSLFAYRGTVGVATASMLSAVYDGYLNGEREVYQSRAVSSGEGTFLFDKGQTVGFTLSDLKVFYQDLTANRLADLYLYAVENVESPQYNVGYAQGFSDGQQSSLGDAGKGFYDQGYTEGFKNGKIEGLQLSDTGDWRHLMLAVTEAPINTFQSLFNFEILGMDMRAAFGSILAVCVVLLIVKKVIF